MVCSFKCFANLRHWSFEGLVAKRIVSILFLCFSSAQGYAANCTEASGTITISINCTQLEISGDGSNVTVAAGVTVDSSGTMAVKTPDAVNVTITNNGTITADGNYGIRNTSPGDIYSLTNNGSIIAGAGGTGNHGIRNGGTITSLSNSGTISAATDRGITNLGGPARSWGTVTNSGLISAGEDFGIRNDGTIDLINNSGQISAGGDNGVWSKGTLTSLINTGTISVGDTDGIKNVSGGIIGTINNSGTISAVSDYGIRNDATSTKFSSLETLINSGTISASRNAIWNDGEIDTLTNSGTIKTTSGDYGIKNVGGTIGTLTNSDTISAGGNWGIYNTTSSDGSATITTLTNTGTISASGNNIGIHNATSSTITTLNNSQGASGSALTYQGKLPTNYNVIVNSTTDFGKTIFSDVSGQTNFGVHSGSTLSEGTYSSVLSGLTASEIASGTSEIHINSNACDDIVGTSATVGSNCGDLDISGSNSNVTISSGVTVSGPGDQNWTLTNSTGSLWDLVVEDEDDVLNTGTATTLTNLGTISTGDDWGILNDTNASFTTLSNSGAISASTDFGIYNKGLITSMSNTGTISAGRNWGIYNEGSATITTLTNTGTISASGNDIGIYNATSSSIATLNNLQGASGSTLTYKGKLPTNYNVIVNSTTDFGKTIFSDVSGQTNFGVHSGSTLSEGTYSSVLSGLTASNISSGVIGTHSNVNACSDVDAANATFSSNCAELDISGDGSDVTINSGITISGVGDYDWTLSNSSGTTWDLVSTAQLDDVVNTGTNTLLNNLGTITALGGGGNGIFNQGSFTTLTNKGLITSDSAHGINNSGTIITFNNLQGASSSALTYKGKLPTNYNVIVKSKTDFGQTIFSDTSGATNFGIHSESILSKGTYSSVLSGLTASEIVSGTSGTVVSGAIRSNWVLANNTGSEWDLVVGNKDITDDTKTSVVKSVKPNIVLGVNNLTSVTEVNFANMNTYDCDLFDKHKICVSFGGRHTVINSPKTKTNSMVLVGGYQVTDALRVGGFFHHNISHKTPASFKLSDKTPLLGGLVVWNEKPNRLGYQLKLANAFQQKYAAVTREVVGSSEEGKGQTVIEAKSFVAELQYGYQFNDNIILRPYFAARSAVIKQDGYTETGSSSPLSFNEIKDKSTTILPGLKLNARLSSNLSLKGSFGIEHDVHHSIDKLAPTGISGLSTVSLSDDFNQNRPVASLGFDYFFKSNHRLSFTAQYQELPYKSKTETNAYLYYTVGF